MQAALRLLALRNHSRAELWRKLQQRGFGPAQIRQATARCVELGYIDERVLADAAAATLLRKGYGRRRIEQDLRRKGLDGALVAAVLAAHLTGDAEAEAGRRALARKQSALKLPAGMKRRAKLQRFLQQRGFGNDLIRRLLDEQGA
jgi:regulatory protein